MRNRPSTFNIDCINDYDDSTTPASMNDQRRDFYYIVMQLPIIKFYIFVGICESKYCCIPNGKQACAI